MSDSTLVDKARAATESARRDWAEFTFPGIDQLSMRTNNLGAGHSEQSLIGSWHGAWIRIVAPGCAHLVERCDTCAQYVAKTGIASFDSTYELGQAIIASSRTNVKACFDCRWLKDAAAAAAQTPPTRRAQRRFERRYGATCGDVIARHNAQCQN